MSVEVLFSYFKSEAAKQAAKELAEKEKIEANVSSHSALRRAVSPIPRSAPSC